MQLQQDAWWQGWNHAGLWAAAVAVAQVARVLLLPHPQIRWLQQLTPAHTHLELPGGLRDWPARPSQTA
jgi:hypothetical protein